MATLNGSLLVFSFVHRFGSPCPLLTGALDEWAPKFFPLPYEMDFLWRTHQRKKAKYKYFHHFTFAIELVLMELFVPLAIFEFPP